MSEFELIQRYFSERQSSVPYVALGIGDDCALMSTRPGMQLAISSDMLVEGRHFFADADARRLGHKALAVNLSDLAAMGAEPRAFTLALALPDARADWLRDFSAGLFDLAALHGCQLIGGDTTKGPLNICITVFGEVPAGQALRRAGAKTGDDIWISGTLGDARLALAGYLNQQALTEFELEIAAVKLHTPTPRVALGMALRGTAHAAIDLSDGLIGDLAHILHRSAVGATVNCDALPCGEILSKQSRSLRYEFALAGGDDYELCFTAAPEQRDALQDLARQIDVPLTRIGTIDAQTGCRFVNGAGDPVSLDYQSFDHFQS